MRYPPDTRLTQCGPDFRTENGGYVLAVVHNIEPDVFPKTFAALFGV